MQGSSFVNVTCAEHTVLSVAELWEGTWLNAFHQHESLNINSQKERELVHRTSLVFILFQKKPSVYAATVHTCSVYKVIVAITRGKTGLAFGDVQHWGRARARLINKPLLSVHSPCASIQEVNVEVGNLRSKGRFSVARRSASQKQKEKRHAWIVPRLVYAA